MVHRHHSTSNDGKRTELKVRGMNCASCVSHVSAALREVPGVAGANVNLESGRATVRWREAERNVEAALAAVKKAGYEAEVISTAETHGGHTNAWNYNVWLGVCATLVLMAGEWILGLGSAPWFQSLSFALASVVQVMCGSRFYKGAWNQLRARNSNMDTLVALGSTTAYGYSVWALFFGHQQHLFFMEAASIITLISLGHWMEARVSARASSALQSLLHLAPETARRREADGAERILPVAELQIADTVVLKPGDRVPTDGEVIEGASSIDESMLTGESAPVEKKAGSPVYAGTVNADGQLLMRVTATGEETALAHIVAAVERAQSSRANIQRLGDRVSSVFVPIVVVIALASGLWWGLAPEQAHAVRQALSGWLWTSHQSSSVVATAIITAAAVLIVACPCAMGLATPTAVMAGSNAAARRGILIRDAVALEKAGEISAVVFDKTGTITEGKPSVAAFEIVSNKVPDPQTLAATLARPSNHPLSRAAAAMTAAELALGDWSEVRGSGVQALLPSNLFNSVTPPSQAMLGSLRWLREQGVELSRAQHFSDQWTSSAATILGLAVDTELVALIALQDAVKPHAPEVVQKLQRQGLQTFLITGDNPRTAAAVAAKVGIPSANVFAEVKPEQKAKLIYKMQASGQHVAFVGDGINDAPALEQAHLGIAVSRASDIARDAADIILLKSEIDAVPESLGLARATLRTIKQNLFWAFFYNAAAIPLAALGFMSPILCAAAMGLSDLVVIGNALRLRRWKPN